MIEELRLDGVLEVVVSNSQILQSGWAGGAADQGIADPQGLAPAADDVVLDGQVVDAIGAIANLAAVELDGRSGFGGVAGDNIVTDEGCPGGFEVGDFDGPAVGGAGAAKDVAGDAALHAADELGVAESHVDGIAEEDVAGDGSAGAGL